MMKRQRKKKPAGGGDPTAGKTRFAGGDVLPYDSTESVACQTLAHVGRRAVIRLVYAGEKLLYRGWLASNDVLLAMLPGLGEGR